MLTIDEASVIRYIRLKANQTDLQQLLLNKKYVFSKNELHTVIEFLRSLKIMQIDINENWP